MFTTVKNLFIVTITMLLGFEAWSCPIAEDREALNHWVCEFNSAMDLRDREADHTRHSDLLTTSGEIKKVRAETVVLDDETCRRYNVEKLTESFQRILQHQSIPRSLFSRTSDLAAAEVGIESSTDKVDVCESQQLISSGQDHTYQNLYYFKYGPVRSNKHFILRVTTKWRH
jgi:hypothetical protein